MIEEDYISYDTAKLMKQKGFDWSCFRYADSKEIYENDEWTTCDVTGTCVGIPTAQAAVKWLREKFKYDIVVFPYREDQYGAAIYFEHNHVPVSQPMGFEKYEYAVEACVRECLEVFIE